MATYDLPHPSRFESLDSPGEEKFPTTLPHRPGKSQSYLSTVFRNYKVRIIVCSISFLAMVGGTVAAAMFISKGMKSTSQGQVALSASSSSPVPTGTAAPTPLRSTMTQTTMVVHTSIVTDRITIPVSRLQSTIYAIATAPTNPLVTCLAGDTGVTCGSAGSGLER